MESAIFIDFSGSRHNFVYTKGREHVLYSKWKFDFTALKIIHVVLANGLRFHNLEHLLNSALYFPHSNWKNAHSSLF